MNAVAKGLPRDTAAKLARIHPSTLFDWLKRGRAGEVGFAEFSDRVREAESKGEDEIVQRLRNHTKTSWQACAWLLERRNPKRWAPRKAEPAAAAGVGGSTQSQEEMLAIAESVVAALRSAG